MGRNYDRISIVTVKEIVEEGKRLEIPMSLEVFKAARARDDTQMELLKGIWGTNWPHLGTPRPGTDIRQITPYQAIVTTGGCLRISR